MLLASFLIPQTGAPAPLSELTLLCAFFVSIFLHGLFMNTDTQIVLLYITNIFLPNSLKYTIDKTKERGRVYLGSTISEIDFCSHFTDCEDRLFKLFTKEPHREIILFQVNLAIQHESSDVGMRRREFVK